MDFNKHIDHIVSMVLEYAPHVIGALVVLFVGLWLIKRLTVVASKAMEKRDLDVSLRTFLRSLISIGLKIFLVVTVAGMVGIGTTSFVTILGAAGLAVGLALQGSLSNFAGGVLLLIFKPYKVGDTIEAQGQTGTVTEIQVFNTILLTGDLKTVILPNGAVSNGTIVNQSKNGFLRTEVTISISAENDLHKVKQDIINALLNDPIILKDPEPTVSVTRIGEGAAFFSIKPYSNYKDSSELASRTNEIVNNVLKDTNVIPAIPQHMVINA